MAGEDATEILEAAEGVPDEVPAAVSVLIIARTGSESVRPWACWKAPNSSDANLWAMPCSCRSSKPSK